MPGKPRKSVKPVPTPPKLNAEDADAEGQRAPTKKWRDFESQTDAVRALAATLKPDEGYESAEWTKLAARGRWGGKEVGNNYTRWRRDLVFRSACEIAYRRTRPPLSEIVNTICEALAPCETHLRERMLRITLEFETVGEVLPGFAGTPREVADELLVEGTAFTDQPYGLRRSEIEIALRHRWPGITPKDIDAGLEEGVECGRISHKEYKAEWWDSAEIVYRVIDKTRNLAGGESKGPYHPASHYKDAYRISPARLRQLKRQGRVATDPAIVAPAHPHYSEPDVKRLFPHKFEGAKRGT